MVDTIIIGIEELLLFVPFSGSPVQIKGAGFMKFAKSLTSLACWLMAIVPGVYLLAYLSARYLHLPSAYYYPILALAAAGYRRLRYIPVPGVSAEMPYSQFRAQP